MSYQKTSYTLHNPLKHQKTQQLVAPRKLSKAQLLTPSILNFRAVWIWCHHWSRMSTNIWVDGCPTEDLQTSRMPAQAPNSANIQPNFALLWRGVKWRVFVVGSSDFGRSQLWVNTFESRYSFLVSSCYISTTSPFTTCSYLNLLIISWFQYTT